MTTRWPARASHDPADEPAGPPPTTTTSVSKRTWALPVGIELVPKVRRLADTLFELRRKRLRGGLNARILRHGGIHADRIAADRGETTVWSANHIGRQQRCAR